MTAPIVDVNAKAWSILTISRCGTVSVIRELTRDEAAAIYERLDPWFGLTICHYRLPSGDVVAGIGSGRTCKDGDIERREVFGPPDWNAAEVQNWNSGWPKRQIIQCDEMANPLA